MEWGERRRIYAKQRYYVWSFDLTLAAHAGLEAMAEWQEPVTLSAAGAKRDDLGAFYHVFDDESVAGPDGRERPVPRGKLNFSQLRLALNPLEGTGTIEGRLSLKTDDGALIGSTYSGVIRESSGVSMVAYEDNEKRRRLPKLRAYITPTYETASSRYRWLVEQQFIAFGELTLSQRAGDETWLTQFTFDSYVALQLGMPAQAAAERSSGNMREQRVANP